MKKTYHRPETKVINIQGNFHLLANSFNGSSLTINDSVMDDGDGSDGVKNAGAWDDIWE